MLSSIQRWVGAWTRVDQFTFFTGNGSANSGTLASPAGAITTQAIVRMIHQTDWQGRVALSNQPRTNQAYDSWIQSGGTYTTGVADPKGGTGSITVTGANIGSGPNVLTASVVAGKLYYGMVFAKSAAATSRFYVTLEGSAWGNNYARAVFDANTGTVTPWTGAHAPVAYGMEPIGNGWYLCWVSSVAPASAVADIDFYSDAPASGFTLFGPQVVDARGPYLPATSSPPVTVTDYTVSGTNVSFGQVPANLATVDWDGFYAH